MVREVMEMLSAALGGGQLRRRRSDLEGRQGPEGSSLAALLQGLLA